MKGRRIFRLVVLGGLALLSLVPLLWMLKTSLRGGFGNYSAALDFLPEETLRGWVFFQNSIVVAALAVLGAVLSSSLVAYAFARLQFPGREWLFRLLISSMLLPSAATLMPQFLLYRSLGWIDSLTPLWAPAFFAGATNVFFLRQVFLSLPRELDDAAKIDGCSVPTTFWRIAIPQCRAALGAVAVWTAVAAWNQFTGPLLFLNSPSKMTLPYAIQLYQGARADEPELLMAFLTMAVFPIVLVFLLFQKALFEGVRFGALRDAENTNSNV